MKSLEVIPFVCLAAALALSACKEPAMSRQDDAQSGRDTRESSPKAGEMEKKGTQSLEDVKRNADNPAGGALIIAPPIGESK